MESALERFELKEQEQHIQGQYQALAQVHPDFEEIAVSPEFNHWISRQPPLFEINWKVKMPQKPHGFWRHTRMRLSLFSRVATQG